MFQRIVSLIDALVAEVGCKNGRSSLKAPQRKGQQKHLHKQKQLEQKQEDMAVGQKALGTTGSLVYCSFYQTLIFWGTRYTFDPKPKG